MVQYHHVHTATTTQAHPGLSEGTVHHSYTHGSYHHLHTATTTQAHPGLIVKVLYTIFILMVHVQKGYYYTETSRP